MSLSVRATGVVIVALVTLGLIVSPVARAESGYRYWTFWVADGSQWQFATEGPATTRTSEGDVVGWRFAVTTATGSKDAVPRVSPEEAFATACSDVVAPTDSHRVAIVLDFGTTSSAPTGETPPQDRIECFVSKEGDTAAQPLSAIAALRIDQGFVCGVDGYPETECAPSVELPDPVLVEPAVAEAAEVQIVEPATSTRTQEQTGSAVPVSLFAFGAIVFAALLGLAFWVTRKRQP